MKQGNIPLVSIIIPVFNREGVIRETIFSAINQTYSNIEVIVVDNCSTDNTMQIISEMQKIDKRILLFQNSSNIGPVLNWKACINKANGKYLKIVWSDDLISENFVLKSVEILEKNSDVGFVFSNISIFDVDTKDIIRKDSFGSNQKISSDFYIKTKLIYGIFPNSPGCAIFRLEDVRNNLITYIPNKHGFDSEQHGIGPDALLFLNIASKYKSIYYSDEITSYFRRHEGSISSITSISGKLSLFYSIAFAYFVESNYLENKDLIRKFNTSLYFVIKKYPKNKFNLLNISDFYMTNINISINPLFQIVYLIKRKYLKLKLLKRYNINNYC